MLFNKKIKKSIIFLSLALSIGGNQSMIASCIDLDQLWQAIKKPFKQDGLRKIKDVSQLSEITIAEIFKPQSIQELQTFIKEKQYQGPLSVKGGGFSQGWQTAYKNGTVINPANLNKMLRLNTKTKQITVQGSATWREVQHFIDPYGLSVKGMQSYNDFSIGGSLGVNVHGRDVSCGSMIETVLAIKVVCADGSLITATREKNSDLFNAAIGGYGGLGIIVEATLQLTDNVVLDLQKEVLSIEDNYTDFFFNKILPNKDIKLHNIDIYPHSKQKKMISKAWVQISNQPTVFDKIRPYKKFFWENIIAEKLLTRFKSATELRFEKEAQNESYRVYRNYEMSHCVNELNPLVKYPTTCILQEYFIPVERMNSFLDQALKIIKDNKINVLNISVRYVPKDVDATLAYAQQDSFAFVFYICVSRLEIFNAWIKQWTQELIDAALDLNGTFYMPYQLYATKHQFQRAYGNRIDAYLAAKHKYDPEDVFNNEMLKKYVLST